MRTAGFIISAIEEIGLVGIQGLETDYRMQQLKLVQHGRGSERTISRQSSSGVLTQR